MAESFQLAAPVVTQLTVNGYAVDEIHLYRRSQRIVAVFVDTLGGRDKIWTIEGPAAAALMQQLNKANLQTKSLERRCMEQAAAAGLFGDPATAGAITGTPD